MPAFTPGNSTRTPFGKNVYLRSTKNLQFESYTLAENSVPWETIDGSPIKILQPGEALAKITSGPDSGKVGPFAASGTADVWTLTKSGTVSGGTYTVSDGTHTTAAIAFDAAASVITAALVAAGIDAVATGGPLSTTAVVFTKSASGPQTLTSDPSLLTGGGSAAIVHTATGNYGALDGRQTTSNLVGLNDTFLPWQLMERDVEVASLYHGAAVQGWCFQRDVSGARIALTNTVADALRSTKGLDLLFH